MGQSEALLRLSWSDCSGGLHDDIIYLFSYSLHQFDPVSVTVPGDTLQYCLLLDEASIGIMKLLKQFRIISSS